MRLRGKKDFKEYLYRAVLYAMCEDQVKAGETYFLHTHLMITVDTKAAETRLKKWIKELD